MEDTVYAYPFQGRDGFNDPIEPQHGMTLRDHFAGVTLSSVMAKAQNMSESTPEERAYMFGQIAGWMYEMADAMIKARGE